MAGHFEDAVEVISAIDSRMKSRKPSSGKTGMAVVAAILVAASLAVPSQRAAAQSDSLWNAACEAYSDGRWNEAATGFETLGANYNAGNAWFKDGHYARAILCYERALKADPSDSDARFNLDYAENFIQDKIDKVPEFFLKSFFRKLCYSISGNAWAWLSLLMLALVNQRSENEKG